MVPVKEPASLGFKIFTIFGILFFLAVVAFLIGVSGTDGDVEVVGPAVTTPAPPASVETAAQAPVGAWAFGAVATVGGGMAGATAGMAMPIFVGLVVLTMLATTGIVLRRREV
jgi:hypothetical protein